MNFKCDDATAEKSSRGAGSPPSSVPGRPGHTLMTVQLRKRENTQGKTKKSAEMWMNLAPVILSETSQKGKGRYHIGRHICESRKTVPLSSVCRAATEMQTWRMDVWTGLGGGWDKLGGP